jgi:hypothetical protein
MKKPRALLLMMVLAMPMALAACQGETAPEGDAPSGDEAAGPDEVEGRAALYAKLQELEEAMGQEMTDVSDMASDLGLEGVSTPPELADRLGLDRERSMAVFIDGDTPIDLSVAFALPLTDEDAFVENVENLGAFDDYDVGNFDAPARFAHDVDGSPMYYVIDGNTAYVSTDAPILESVGARVANPNPPLYLQEPRIGSDDELVVIASPSSVVESITTQAGQQARALESMLAGADELVLALDLARPGLALRAAMRMKEDPAPAAGLALHQLMPEDAVAVIDASIPPAFKNAARQSVRALAPSPDAAGQIEGIFNMIASQLGEEFAFAVAPNPDQPLPAVMAVAEIQSAEQTAGLLGLAGVDTTAPVETYNDTPIYSTGQNMPTPTPIFVAMPGQHIVASNGLSVLKAALDRKTAAAQASPLPASVAEEADYGVVWVDVRRALEAAMPVMGVQESPDLAGVEGHSSLVIGQEGPWLQAVLDGTAVLQAAPVVAPILMQAGGGMTPMQGQSGQPGAPMEAPAQ